jgi:anti-sigma B factor antagonist
LPGLQGLFDKGFDHLSSMEFEVQYGSRDNVSILRCRGRLIYGPEAEEFVRAVRQALQSGKEIVLHMADVTQIDSGGVGALGTAFTSAHNRGAEIKLAALNPRVAEVLRITGLELLFDRRDSESEAIAAFLKKEKPEKTWLEVAAETADHRP